MFFIVGGNLYAQDSTKSGSPTKRGPHFVDKNGDGYNDNAPDHDGDGIPNGLDPDYQKIQKQKRNRKHKFIDMDGDGIDDNLMHGKRKRQNSGDQSNQKSKGKPLNEQDQTQQKQRQKKGSVKQ